MSTSRRVAATAVWTAVGVLAGFGPAAALTYGPLLLVAALALALLAVVALRWSLTQAPALLLGAAVAPLYVAWLNRGGPGEVCRAVPGGTTCVDRWSPWPILGLAVLLAAAGVGLLVLSPRASGSTRQDQGREPLPR